MLQYIYEYYCLSSILLFFWSNSLSELRISEVELGLKHDSAALLEFQGLLNVLQGVTAMTSLLGVTGIDLRCACMCVYARAGEYVCAFFSVTFFTMAPTEGKQMGATAVFGKNMKNVIKKRKLKREICPARRGNITYASTP